MKSRPSGQQRRGQSILIVALLLAGFGNLVVPSVVQDILPVDYLLITLGLCGLAILYNLKLVTTRVGMWWPGLAFIVLCLPGFLVSPINAYGLTKAQALAVALVMFLTCAAVHNAPTFIMRFSLAAVGIGTIFTVAAQLFGTLDVGGRLVFLGLNPIGIGRVAGLVLSLVLTLIITRKVRAPLAVLGLLVVAAAAAAGVVATGSRGPLVAAAVGLGGLLLFLVTTKRLAPRIFVLITLAGVAVVGAVALTDSAGLTRLSTATDSGRATLYEESLKLAVANPLGIGWGQLGQYIVDFRAVDEESLYAHNVFLEVFVEGGVVALIAFTALLILCLVRAWRAAVTDQRFTVVWVVLLYAVASAQFSSDIVGNRLMWVVMGFSLLAGWWVTHEGPTTRSEKDFLEVVPGAANSRQNLQRAKR